MKQILVPFTLAFIAFSISCSSQRKSENDAISTPTVKPKPTLTSEPAPSATTEVITAEASSMSTDSEDRPSSLDDLQRGDYILAFRPENESFMPNYYLSVFSGKGELILDLDYFEYSDILVTSSISADLDRLLFVRHNTSSLSSPSYIWENHLYSGERTNLRYASRCQAPSLAPNGVDFVASCISNDSGGRNIIVFLDYGREIISLADWQDPINEFLFPVWSPDGKWIAYSLSLGGQKIHQNEGIYISPLSCIQDEIDCRVSSIGPIRTLASRYVWSPESNEIAFSEEKNIVVYNLEDKSSTSIETGEPLYVLGWSSDGLRLLAKPGGLQSSFRDKYVELDLSDDNKRTILLDCRNCKFIDWITIDH